MAEKIVIAQLDIDEAALIKATSDVKKQIDILNAAQKDLTKTGEQGSEQFVKNAANLKVLRGAYNENVKAISNNTKATVDAANREKLLEIALAKTPVTIKEAREQTKLLNRLRNETNVTSAEGRAELELLNNKLDENTEFIRENADGLLKLKLNIGNYAEGVREGVAAINPLNGGISGFISRANDAGGAGNLLTNSLGAATKGIIGLTKSTLAFLATPIGLVIAAVAAAFALVQNALNRSEESTNKLRIAFSSFTGIISKVLGFLEPLGELLIDGIVVGLQLAEKAVFGLIDSFGSLISSIPFLEDAGASIQKFGKELEEAAESAKVLEAAEIALEKAQQRAQLVQLQFQKDAEKLRQIRDDESLSFRERIQANEDLGAVLQQQLEVERAIAEQALAVAELRIEQEGETTSAIQARIDALTEVADIEERITGQQSEQLTNRNSLIREAAAAAKEAAQESIDIQNKELDLLIERQGIRKKGLEEQLQFDREVAQERIRILREQLDEQLITELDFNLQSTQITNELAEQQRNVAIENAEFELNLLRENNQSKIEEGQFLNDTLLQQERDRLQGITDAQIEFEALRLERGEITQREFNTLINTINEENRLANEELELERKEQDAEAEAIDLDNKRILQAENFDIDLAARLAELERLKAIEIANAESVGADTALIDQKFAALRNENERQVANNKSQLAADAFGNIAAILGKESKAGKAAAIAETTITTFQSATNAFNSLSGIPIVGPVLGAIAAAAAVASGIANVKKITSTKPPSVEKPNLKKFAKGTIQKIDGPSHSAGGVPVFAGNKYIGEAEGNEGIGILNRRAFSSFLDFNNSFLGGKSKTGFFQGGGIITQAINSPGVNENNTEDIVNEIRNIKVQVAVEEINDGVNNFAEIVSGADD